MASLDIVIGYHKLDTEFFSGHVRNTAFHSDASRGARRVEVTKYWYRDRELGRGTFGTVFLEKSEKGEYRAVKDIAKDKNTGSRVAIDYRRELMAMASLVRHDALFVQFLGWYESEACVHTAMEYISNGHLRDYLEAERLESEAKPITRQLLEGLLVIHQEGFAHRDLKPENISVVCTSPIWVKIGDFGLAKLARDDTAFRSKGGTRGYVAPEAGIDTYRKTSEYTNAIDIWALGCVTHEMLTQTLPFRGFGEFIAYCSCPKLPRGAILSKKVSKPGIGFVERALAYPLERRIMAREALELEWLRQEDNNEDELLRLLGDDEALGVEVAMGVIGKLVIPSPGGQTPLVEKEVLFPAYLINVVTSEMWNNGYVKESEQFLVNVMHTIKGEAMVSEGSSKMSL